MLTLRNGGEVFIGALATNLVRNDDGYDLLQSGKTPIDTQRGKLYLASQAGATGIINFGSDPEQQVGGATSGSLVADSIVLGPGNAVINFNHSQDVLFSALVPTLDASQQGSGSLTLASYAGTTHLDVAQPGFHGFTDIYGGTFWIDDAQALGSSVIRSGYRQDIPGGGTLGYGNALDVGNAMQLAQNAKLSLRVDGSDSATQSGAISGAGNLLKVGSGTLALTADNSYTGITTVSEGTLALQGGADIAESAGVIADGTFDVSGHSGAASITTLAGGGSVVLGGNDLDITAADSNGAGSGLFTGVISGAGGLNLTGGTQTLGGANTWQGPTLVGNGATLAAAATNAFSPNSVYTVQSGGTLALNGFDQSVDTLNNAGLVVLNNPFGEGGFRPTTLTVTGAHTYTGNGGTVVLNTQLGGDDSPTDKLVVNGDTAGTTALVVRNAGGDGGQTVEGIQVVQVDGASAGKFTLGAPVQAGAYEYRLFQGTPSDPDNGHWYLSSSGELPAPCPSPEPGPCPGPDSSPEPDYRPGVANVVAAQTANMEQGMTLLSSLHQRIGGTYDLTDGELLGWQRLYNDNQRAEGDRFNYDQHVVALQFGHDLWVTADGQGNTQRAGVVIDYAKGDTDFGDQARPQEGYGRKHTGSMDSNTLSAGGYYTLAQADGSYLDTVGMLSHIRNGYDDIYDDHGTQKAWRLGLSAEVGKPVLSFARTWKVEPQAQLSYQHTWYDSFHDDVGKIDSYGADSLRGRLGVRVLDDRSDAERPGQVYAVANLLHDFIKPEKVDFEGTKLREDYDRTFGEVGVGGRLSVGENSTLFGDARYRQSFGGDSRGSVFNVGIQIDF
ncbi:hypothetical protein A9972_16955 [Pseudomonas sp. UME83]|nr:hypothetical protein [Pseudomonas sp. UMC76]MBB1639728.1 hypothetical protein [Pseudomonas sp. UME83]